MMRCFASWQLFDFENLPKHKRLIEEGPWDPPRLPDTDRLRENNEVRILLGERKEMTVDITRHDLEPTAEY